MCASPPLPPPPQSLFNKTVCLPDSNGNGPAFLVATGREIKGTETCCCAMIRLGTPLMTGQQGILFTILTCMTFSTQIHVLFQRVKTERGMCRACCEGIQTPNALVPLTNANSFHLHSTRATPSNTHTHTNTPTQTHTRTHKHTHEHTRTWTYTYSTHQKNVNKSTGTVR